MTMTMRRAYFFAFVGTRAASRNDKSSFFFLGFSGTAAAASSTVNPDSSSVALSTVPDDDEAPAAGGGAVGSKAPGKQSAKLLHVDPWRDSQCCFASVFVFVARISWPHWEHLIITSGFFT